MIWPLAHRRITSPPSILLTLVALFTLIAGGAALLAQKQLQNVLERAVISDGVVVRMTAMVLQEHKIAIGKILESYAASPVLVEKIMNRDTAGLAMHLAILKKDNPELDLPFVTDDRGLLLAEYPDSPQALPRDLPGQEWYKGVSASRMPYLSPIFQPPSEDTPPAVAMVVTVFAEPGRVIGILGNVSRLTAIHQLFDTLDVAIDETIYLLDQTGNIIYNSRAPVERITPYPFYADLRQAVAAKKTRLETVDPDSGKKYLAIATTSIDWTIVVERSLHDTIVSEIRPLMRVALIAILLFLLVAAFILYQNSLHQKTLTLLQLERQLRQSEKKYRCLIDSIPDILYSFSERPGDCYYSPRVEPVLGYTAEYLQSHPRLWQNSIAPEHLPEVNRAIESASGGNHVELEYCIFDIRGRRHWLADRMTSMTDEDGKTQITGLARDITDRKSAEAALRKSREKYRSLVENMLDGFAYCRMLYDNRGAPIDFVCLEVNDAFARLTGLKNVQGRRFGEIYPGTFTAKEDLLDRCSRVALTGNSDKFELYFAPWSMWLDLSVASHERGHILLVFSNITHGKLLAQQRLDALNLLQNIADRVPGVVFQCRLNVDGSFSFPFLSKGLREIYRLAPREIEEDASRFFAVHHPEDRDDVVASLERSAEELLPWMHEYRLQFADGTERWMSGSAVPQRAEDGATLWHGVITDITERKQAIDALRESELRLSTAARVARFGVYSYDFATGQAFYSPEFLDLFGLPPGSELALDEDQIAKALHPEDKPGLLAQVRAALDPCGSWILEHEYRIIRTDGEIRWLRVIGKTIFSGHTAGDRPLQANGIVQDITERRQAEEQLRTLNDELERRVERRTRELQETQAHFLHAEKLSAIGKLSASIAHEFNSPLQAVTTVLKGLQLTAPLETEDRKLLHAAIDEIARMKNLMRSLQDFNRPSSGKKVLMDVHASIDSILMLCRSDFNRKGIEVVLHYAGRLPQIMAIPDQIKQVFLNLLNNAADALLDQAGVITIRTWQRGQQVAIAITDTGIGIAPEKMELIFQPFYTTKPEIKGTGLGLSVCHGIMQTHHGEIQVESRPGKGSTFTVLLPIDGR